MTNVLVEGGSRLLGSLFDARLIDEVHVFIAPKLAGGEAAPGPIGGRGIDKIAAAMALRMLSTRQIGTISIYLGGSRGKHGKLGCPCRLREPLPRPRKLCRL